MTPFERTVTTQQPEKIGLMREGKSGAYKAVYKDGTIAIVKPQTNVAPKTGRSAPQGIPFDLVPLREVAFYRLARLMHAQDIVSETVLGTLRGRPASFARYVPATPVRDLNPELRKPVVDDDDRVRWRAALADLVRQMAPVSVAKLLALDLLAGSRDRHLNNCGATIATVNGAAQWQLAAWDNGACLGLYFRRYRSVFHRAVGDLSRAHPEEARVILDETARRLGLVQKDELATALLADGLVPVRCVEHAWLRASFFADYPHRLHHATLVRTGGEGFRALDPYFDPAVGPQQRTALRVALAHAPSAVV